MGESVARPDVGSPDPVAPEAPNRVVSYIAGNVIFLDTRHPGHVDLQATAFREALRNAAQLSKDSGFSIGPIMTLVDQVGSWEDHLDPAYLKQFTGNELKRRKKSPRLSSFHPHLVSPLRSIADEYRISLDDIKAVPEQKLRHILGDKLGLKTCPSERVSVLTGRQIVEPGKEERNGSPVIRCRGIAAALFDYASQKDFDFKGASDVHMVRGFFQTDPTIADRVMRQIILDGAVFAQQELGVTCPIRVFFYQTVAALSNPLVSVHSVEDGKIEPIQQAA